MSTFSAQDLASYDASIRLDNAALIGELREILGATLVAYLGRVGETRAVRQWADGVRTPSAEVLRRMRVAYRIADLIRHQDGTSTAQAWFTGLNPVLDDQSPATLIRDGDPEAIGPTLIAAARTFIGGA